MKKIYLRTYHPLSIYSDDLVFKMKKVAYAIGDEIPVNLLAPTIMNLFAIGWNVMLLHNKDETTLYIDQWTFKSIGK